ncbi:MAG: hypothetical protein Tsb0014_37470 [Pleurocapsa sp.]
MNSNSTTPNNTVNLSTDPGSTLQTAYDLGILENSLTINESVGGSDQGDVYQFEVTESGQYSFDLANSDADVELYIVNSAGQTVYHISNSASGTINDLSFGFNEGTYFAAIVSTDGSATDYTLNISNPSNSTSTKTNTITPSTDPDFTFNNAYDLGVIDSNLAVNESVGGTDDGDGYQFEITESGTYNFTLDGLSANAELWIFDSQGNTIDSSALTGSQAESVTLDLTAGTYFAGIASADGVETDYTFEIASDGGLNNPPNTNVITPPTDPDFTFNNAYDLGVIDSNLAVNESVGGTDDGDGYQFEITESGTYNFTLDGLSANAELWIFDSQGNTIDSSALTGNQAESVTLDLTAGTYFAGIASADGVETDYTFEISSDGGSNNPPTDNGDAGDTFDTALDVGTLESGDTATASGSIGGTDTWDIFQFTIDEASDFEAVLDGLDADVDLGLWNSEGTLVDGSTTTGTSAENLSAVLDIGTYYVGVVSYDGVETPYDLEFTVDGSTNSYFSSLEAETTNSFSEVFL